VRHSWLGAHLTPEMLGLALDKWQIGPLRVLNLFAFSCIIYWSRKYLTRVVLVEPFLTLGKASLEVFCAHLFFVFVGLALLYGEMNELHGPYAIVLLTITFTALILIAIREVRRKRKARQVTPAGEANRILRQDVAESFHPVPGLNPPTAESGAEG
jgi:fucose 4-O-acetylase-like acetyltransferase